MINERDYETIKTRTNIIYYQDENENIQEYRVYQHGKVKQVEAKKILSENNILYTSVIKVLLDTITLKIPRQILKKYMTTNK